MRVFADWFDVGLVLDMAHAGSVGEDLVAVWRVFDSRLANVHLSDWRPAGGEAARGRLSGAITDHLFPGAGTLPLAGLLADLAGSRYARPVTLKVNPFAARFWWPPAIRRRLAQAAAWMRAAR